MQTRNVQLSMSNQGVEYALVGSNGIEPSTSRLSGVRSNHLSYEPTILPLPELLRIAGSIDDGPAVADEVSCISPGPFGMSMGTTGMGLQK